MAISKVYRDMKIEEISKMPQSAWDFLYMSEQNPKEYPKLKENAARNLAEKMTGQYGWEGIKPEMTGITGLARLANKHLATTATTLRIKETIVFGNGTSRYILV